MSQFFNLNIMKCHFFYEPRRYTLLIGRILLFNTINMKEENKEIVSNVDL